MPLVPPTAAAARDVMSWYFDFSVNSFIFSFFFLSPSYPYEGSLAWWVGDEPVLFGPPSLPSFTCFLFSGVFFPLSFPLACPFWLMLGVSFCLFYFCFIFIFVFVCFLIIILFLFWFLFLFFSYSLFQCISVADVCMLCLSYPVLGRDIALSNALRCIISVS